MPTTSECEKAQEVVRKCPRKATDEGERGKCVRKASGEEIDAGNFSVERLAKAGDDLVTAAIIDEKFDPSQVKAGAGRQPLAPVAGKTSKQNLCQGKKGSFSKCRMQLVTKDGEMALRLCDKDGDPGFLAVVPSVQAARKLAVEFCACKEEHGAAKCARNIGATVRG